MNRFRLRILSVVVSVVLVGLVALLVINGRRSPVTNPSESRPRSDSPPSGAQLIRTPNSSVHETERSNTPSPVDAGEADSLGRDLDRIARLYNATKERQLSQLEAAELDRLIQKTRKYAWSTPDQYLRVLTLIKRIELHPSLIQPAADALFAKPLNAPGSMKSADFIATLVQKLLQEDDAFVRYALAWPLHSQRTLGSLDLLQVEDLVAFAANQAANPLMHTLLSRLVSSLGSHGARFPILVDRFSEFARDPNGAIVLRKAGVQALSHVAYKDIRAARTIAELMGPANPHELRTVAVMAASPELLQRVSGSSEASAVLLPGLISVVAQEQDSVLASEAAGILAVYDNDSALKTLADLLDRNKSEQIMASVAEGVQNARYSTKARYLQAQELSSAIVLHAADDGTRIAAIDALVATVPRTIYSGGTSSLVVPQAGQEFVPDADTLSTISSALAGLLNSSSPRVREHLVETALPALEAELTFLQNYPQYEALKREYLSQFQE